jgi:serine-type D-Ala-D-Ala carboxypeptidase (penicillin-binding protein 5/6)
MILKPLIVFSLILNLVGLNLSADGLDLKVAENYSKEDYQTAKASDPVIFQNKSITPFLETNHEKAYINSKNYSLIDGQTGVEIIGKDSEQRVPIASLTKIMTAIIALENYQLDDIVTVPYEATVQIPTVVYLRTGEQITVSELLHCLLIRSGNDAAYAMATFMDKENESDPGLFIEKMNQKTRLLGLENTRFFDSAGLSDEGYSTAKEIGVITRYALLNPVIKEIIKTAKYVATNTSKTIFHQLENSNRLITTYQYPGAIGVKTGFTYAASHCLVGAAERDGNQLIAVILGTHVHSPTASATEARNLLDWGFANVNWPN